VEFSNGQLKEYALSPSDFGLKQGRYEDVASKQDARGNALAALKVLAGRDDGPLADFLAANAAVALRLADKVQDLASGVDQAREALASGAALERLRGLVATQNSHPNQGLARLEGMLKQV
jgi:anthranilate phosphoribosyltransferase